MRDVPWRTIAAEVFSTVCAKVGTGNVTEMAARLGLHDVSALKRHLQNWRRQSCVVEDILTWRRCSPTEMCEASRPGAWLADVVSTVMLVEQKSARPTLKFVAVGKDDYVERKEVTPCLRC